MDVWSDVELRAIGAAEELDLAARVGETLSAFTTIWVAAVGGDVYVRSGYGPESAWYRRVAGSDSGRIRSGGVERDVRFVLLWADDPVHDAIDAAYLAKYGRYGNVATVTGPAVRAVTLRVEPLS